MTIPMSGWQYWVEGRVFSSPLIASGATCHCSASRLHFLVNMEWTEIDSCHILDTFTCQRPNCDI